MQIGTSAGRKQRSTSSKATGKARNLQLRPDLVLTTVSRNAYTSPTSSRPLLMTRLVPFLLEARTPGLSISRVPSVTAHVKSRKSLYSCNSRHRRADVEPPGKNLQCWSSRPCPPPQPTWNLLGQAAAHLIEDNHTDQGDAVLGIDDTRNGPSLDTEGDLRPVVAAGVVAVVLQKPPAANDAQGVVECCIGIDDLNLYLPVDFPAFDLSTITDLCVAAWGAAGRWAMRHLPLQPIAGTTRPSWNREQPWESNRQAEATLTTGSFWMVTAKRYLFGAICPEGILTYFCVSSTRRYPKSSCRHARGRGGGGGGSGTRESAQEAQLMGFKELGHPRISAIETAGPSPESKKRLQGSCGGWGPMVHIPT